MRAIPAEHTIRNLGDVEVMHGFHQGKEPGENTLALVVKIRLPITFVEDLAQTQEKCVTAVKALHTHIHTRLSVLSLTIDFIHHRISLRLQTLSILCTDPLRPFVMDCTPRIFKLLDESGVQ